MLWSANRGFDLGDEGLYMLSLSDPEHYKVLAHGYFLNKVLPISEFTIPVSRTISIFLELSAGLVFTFGLFKWLRQRVAQVSFWAIWALVLLGSFQSILARCVSYNDLVNFFGLTSAGTLLYALTLDNGKKQFLLLVASAFLLTFCTVFKAPVTISLSLLFLGLITFYGNNSKKSQFLKALGAWVIGATITAIAYTALYNGLCWMDVIAQVKATADLLNYRPSDLVLMYVIYDGLPNLIFVGGGAGIFALVQFVTKRAIPSQPIIGFIIAATTVIVIGQWAIETFKILLVPEEQAIYFYLWEIIGVVLYLLYQLNKQTEGALKRQLMLVALFLLALPVAMIGGTNGFITETLPTFFIPWFGVIALALLHLNHRGLPAIKQYILVSIVTIASLLQFIESKVSHPFGTAMSTSIFAQKVPIQSKDGILVDKPTLEYLGKYLSLMKQHSVYAQTPIIGLNYMPGLVYLTGGYSPGAPFYIYHPDFNHYNCHFINQTAQLGVRPVIMYRSSTQPEVLECLKNAGFGFPEDYTAAEPIPDPYSNVYEDEGATDGMLYVFFPN